MANTVANLLTQSRAAHTAYRQLAHKRDNRDQAQRQAADIGGHLWDSYHARLQAHELDPRQVDPAWVEDFTATRVESSVLLDFYANFLDLPADSVQKAAKV